MRRPSCPAPVEPRGGRGGGMGHFYTYLPAFRLFPGGDGPWVFCLPFAFSRWRWPLGFPRALPGLLEVPLGHFYTYLPAFRPFPVEQASGFPRVRALAETCARWPVVWWPLPVVWPARAPSSLRAHVAQTQATVTIFKMRAPNPSASHNKHVPRCACRRRSGARRWRAGVRWRRSCARKLSPLRARTWPKPKR